MSGWIRSVWRALIALFTRTPVRRRKAPKASDEPSRNLYPLW